MLLKNADRDPTIPVPYVNVPITDSFVCPESSYELLVKSLSNDVYKGGNIAALVFQIRNSSMYPLNPPPVAEIGLSPPNVICVIGKFVFVVTADATCTLLIYIYVVLPP